MAVRTRCLGGLRVRAGHDQRLTAAARLRQAVLLAAVLDLIPSSTFSLGMVRGEWGHIFPSMLFSWVNLALGLLTLAAAAGAWFGRRAVVAVTALAAAVLWTYQPQGGQLTRAIEPVFALVVLAILVIRRDRLPRAWLWLAAIVFAAYLIPSLDPVIPLLNSYLVPFAVLGATIAWSIIDARPMAATALWLAVTFGAFTIRNFARFGPHIYLWFLWFPAIIFAAVTIAGIWRVWRQAIL